MAKSLNCPTCGAPAASPEATRCDYCASTLTSMGCPACFGVMFAGMQFCPHCGAKGDRVASEDATLACPGCSGAMKGARLGSTSLFECAGCHSTWLDADTFRHLCADREERGAIAALVGSGPKGISVAKGGAVRYVPCPLCKRVMNRENFGKRSGVIIDVCKGHGVWFEPRELHSVMAFIDSGGLARAGVNVPSAPVRMAILGSSAPAPASTTGSSSPSSFAESLLDDALRMLFS